MVALDSEKGYAPYRRTPKYEIEKLTLLADGYFRLLETGGTGAVLWFAFVFLLFLAQGHVQAVLLWFGYIVDALVVGFGVHQANVKTVQGYGGRAWIAWIPTLVTAISAFFMGGLMGVWLMQAVAGERMKTLGVKIPIFARRDKVFAKIQELRKRNEPELPQSFEQPH